MKKAVNIFLAILLVCLFAGCAPQEETPDPIVGQWVDKNGTQWRIMLANGDAFDVCRNAVGMYITSSVNVYKEGTYDIREDGGYTSYHTWYKKDGTYYWKDSHIWTVHIADDTLVFGDSIHEWYRMPEDEWILFDEIYYSTYDEENGAYISHKLSNLIGE